MKSRSGLILNQRCQFGGGSKLTSCRKSLSQVANKLSIRKSSNNIILTLYVQDNAVTVLSCNTIHGNQLSNLIHLLFPFFRKTFFIQMPQIFSGKIPIGDILFSHFLSNGFKFQIGLFE